ncbi:MAG: hypothetical protein PHR53_00415 [Bacteroidales bacterium]|nr:hypothetical protein [Bacteroidales bacterium]
MKIRFLGLFFWMLLVEILAAQKSFSGKIEYEIMMEGDVSPIVASAIPEKMTVLVRNGMIREDLMGQIALYNGIEKTLSLFVEGGKRVAIVQTSAEILQNEKIKQLTIDSTSETKIIAGYVCQKKVVKYFLNQEEVVQSLYYTPEINAGNAYQMHAVFRNINGFPLEYEMYMKGVRLLFSAVKVQEEKVDKRLFSIPKGYEVYRNNQ